MTVTGYADNTGSSQSNVYLSELRAQRVIDGLMADGIPAQRLKLVAAGAAEPARRCQPPRGNRHYRPVSATRPPRRDR